MPRIRSVRIDAASKEASDVHRFERVCSLDGNYKCLKGFSTAMQDVWIVIKCSWLRIGLD
jgi:hypothetical protein